MLLFYSRSQKTPKYGKNISDTLGCRFVCHFFALLHFDVRNFTKEQKTTEHTRIFIGGGCATVSSLTNPMRDCERAIAKRKGSLFLECPMIFIAIPF